MITLNELYPIGFVSKTHGVKGELNVSLDTPYNPEDFKFLVFDIDSIFVPFEIVGSRGNGLANRLVALKDIDSVEEARQFAGKTVYVLKRELHQHPDYGKDDDGEEMLYLSDLVGFELTDEDGKPIGNIVGYNDSTQNYLLEIHTADGKDIYVPFVEEWITEIDSEHKKIAMNLPLGLL